MSIYTLSQLKSFGLIIPDLSKVIDTSYSQLVLPKTDSADTTQKLLSMLNTTPLAISHLVSTMKKIQDYEHNHKVGTDKHHLTSKLINHFLFKIQDELQLEIMAAFLKKQKLKKLAAHYAALRRAMREEERQRMEGIIQQDEMDKAELTRLRQQLAEIIAQKMALEREIEYLTGYITEIKRDIAATNQVIAELRIIHHDSFVVVAREVILPSGKKLLEGVDLEEFKQIRDRYYANLELQVTLQSKIESNDRKIARLMEKSGEGEIPQHRYDKIEKLRDKNANLFAQLEEARRDEVRLVGHFQVTCYVDQAKHEDVHSCNQFVTTQGGKFVTDIQPQILRKVLQEDNLEEVENLLVTANEQLQLMMESQQLLEEQPGLENPNVEKQKMSTEQLIEKLDIMEKNIEQPDAVRDNVLRDRERPPIISPQFGNGKGYASPGTRVSVKTAREDAGQKMETDKKVDEKTDVAQQDINIEQEKTMQFNDKAKEADDYLLLDDDDNAIPEEPKRNEPILTSNKINEKPKKSTELGSEKNESKKPRLG